MVCDGKPGQLAQEPFEVFVVDFEAGQRVRPVVERDAGDQCGPTQEDVGQDGPRLLSRSAACRGDPAHVSKSTKEPGHLRALGCLVTTAGEPQHSERG